MRRKLVRNCINLLAFLAAWPWASALGQGSDTLGVGLPHQPVLRPEKTAWATRIESPPVLDGYPDDSCWAAALPIADFIQQRPDEGSLPSERTEVRIIYDDKALYALFICHDSEPQKIEALLTPRDHIASSDNVRLFLDSFFDRRTAFQFTVNAVNVQEDAIYTEDTHRDESWNAVWSSAVKVHDYGWVAELRIPLSVLRFGRKPFHTWGLNLSRYIVRRRETIQWRMIPQSQQGFYVSRFGLLGGLEGLNLPQRLELQPFALGQLQDNEVMRNDLTRNFGLDVKYGPGPNTTLDLTVNPEFGTVETDEEQLNLSPFPTYYPEKRPFFLEFQDIFRTDINLVHTRRIGRPLSNVVNPNATILAGARLVGKTGNNVRYGLVETVVDRENFYYMDDDQDAEFEGGAERAFRLREDCPPEERRRLAESYLEPRTNYFIGRVLKEYRNQSSLGVIGTAVNRDLDPQAGTDWAPYAYTGGVDWDFRLGGAYRFAGQLAGSGTEEEGNKREGYGLELKAGKFSGEHLTYGVNYDRYSDEFRVNDLGWLYGNDYGEHRLGANLQLEGRPQAHGVRSFSTWCQVTRNWTDPGLDELMGMVYGNRYDPSRGVYQGEKLSNAIFSMTGTLGFMNYWSIYGGIWRGLDAGEDAYRAAEDHDFIFAYPKSWSLWYGLSNDFNSRVRIGFNQSMGRFRDGNRWGGRASLSFRPSPRIEMYFSPEVERYWDYSEFSDARQVEGEQVPDQILTLRRTGFESFVFRTSFTPSTRLDFRLFAQYTDFSSERYQPVFEPFAIDSPLEASSTLGLHFVTRFEYRPGSFFYLVYRENRFDEDDGRGFGRPDRQIIGKFTYWLKQS